MNRRSVAVAVGVAVAAVFLGSGVYSTLNRDAVLTPTDVLHKIDLTASVVSVNTDIGWSQDGGTTKSGALRLLLDDQRVLTIPEGTMVDDYDAVAACTDFVTPNACVLLADMLGEEPVRVLSAASGPEALALLEREPVEVILCDQAMPGMNGTEVLAQVAARHPRTVRLMLTGQQDLAEIDAALRSGVLDAHYAKPVSASSLRERVREALALQRSRALSNPLL